MNETAGLELADWRRRTAESYSAVRHTARQYPRTAWRGWVARRDEMFRTHAQSPLEPEARARFGGLPYYPYNPAWRAIVEVEPLDGEAAPLEAKLPEGLLRYRAFGKVRFTVPDSGNEGQLLLYWLDGYGGGLFLPFGDATNGDPAQGGTTYGGGRYLYDTIKGADLGARPNGLVLDFNFAYNPSCAYSPQWVCPLAPLENRLAFPIAAGERLVDPNLPRSAIE